MQGGAEKLVKEGFELVVKKEGQRVQWAHCVLPKFIRKAMGNDQLTNLPHLLRRLESSLRTYSHFDWNRLTPRSPCTGLVVIYDHLSVCACACVLPVSVLLSLTRLLTDLQDKIRPCTAGL